MTGYCDQDMYSDDMVELCNATAVSASTIGEEGVEGVDWDRVVTMAMGVTCDCGCKGQKLLTGVSLTAAEARELAQELLAAADLVDSGAPLPMSVTVADSDAPAGLVGRA